MRALSTIPPGAAIQQMTVEVISGTPAGLVEAEAPWPQAAAASNHGTPTLTGNPCDVAIEGEGYFQVRLASGETAYSRAGTFELNEQGCLVTLHGHPLLPLVTMPRGTADFAISASGCITATPAGVPRPAPIGQLQLATFMNPGGLEPIGEDLFRTTVLSGAPHVAAPGDAELHMGSVLQNYIEAFADDAFLDIAALVLAQRAAAARLRPLPVDPEPVSLRRA